MVPVLPLLKLLSTAASSTFAALGTTRRACYPKAQMTQMFPANWCSAMQTLANGYQRGSSSPGSDLAEVCMIPEPGDLLCLWCWVSLTGAGRACLGACQACLHSENAK